VDKLQLASLAGYAWISKRRGILIIGRTGLGKTFIGCALRNQASRQGKTAQFHRLSELYDQIRDAQPDGPLPKLKLSLTKPNLLILDDFGIREQFDSSGRNHALHHQRAARRDRAGL
jgi:DNA replication protein DnaC